MAIQIPGKDVPKVEDDQVGIVRSTADLAALAPEWDQLARRNPDHFLTQTFQWTDAALSTITGPRELVCITLRSGGRLAGVWPLVIERRHGSRTLRPVGFDVYENSAPLLDAGPQAERQLALMWRTATRCADAAVLPNARTDSPVCPVLKRDRHWRVINDISRTFHIRRDDYPDWAAFHKTVSSKLRYEIRSRRRHLAEKGKIFLGVETADATAIVDWMLDHKKRWLERTGYPNDWIARTDHRDFLIMLVERGSAVPFALKVDGTPIAGALLGIDVSQATGFLIVHDPAWADFSPGNIVAEHVIQWAFEKGLGFDFGNGHHAYKERWTKRACDTATWHIALRWRGWPAIARLRLPQLADHWRRKLALRTRLKALRKQ